VNSNHLDLKDLRFASEGVVGRAELFVLYFFARAKKFQERFDEIDLLKYICLILTK